MAANTVPQMRVCTLLPTIDQLTMQLFQFKYTLFVVFRKALKDGINASFFFSYLQRESPCFPLNVEYLTKELIE